MRSSVVLLYVVRTTSNQRSQYTLIHVKTNATMLSFADVQEGAATCTGFLLTNSCDTYTAVIMFMVLACVYHSLVVIFAWGGLPDLLEFGPCWWQVSSFGGRSSLDKSWCRRTRLFRCQKRARRRKKKAGDSCIQWECPFSKMPPPLPFRRRRACCTQDVTEVTTDNRAVIMTESQSQVQPDEESPATRVNDGESKITDKKSVAGSKVHQRIVRKPAVQASTLDLARMQQWDRLADRVRANRREAKHVDADGLMPLHWACSGGPTLEVIQALLHAYPRAARRVDSDGSTALHFASHYGGSASVVQALVEASPRAIYTKDKYGRVPLYHAAEKSSSLDVLRILLNAGPSMAFEPSLPPTSCRQSKTKESQPVNHRTPLHITWAKVTSSRQIKRRGSGKAWDKANLLLEAAYQELHAAKQRKNRKTYRMLHATIALDSYLPPETIHLAIKLHPEQLRQADGLDGRLPLAMAAASCSPRAPELVQILCSAYPQAARAFDFQGRTALAIAVASGKQWNQGVKSIFDTAPETATWRDRKSGLYPALAAASVTRADNDDPSNIEDLQMQSNILPTSSSKDKALDWCEQMTDTTKASGALAPSHVDADSTHLSTIFALIQADPAIMKRQTSLYS